LNSLSKNFLALLVGAYDFEVPAGHLPLHSVLGAGNSTTDGVDEKNCLWCWCCLPPVDRIATIAARPDRTGPRPTGGCGGLQLEGLGQGTGKEGIQPHACSRAARTGNSTTVGVQS